MIHIDGDGFDDIALVNVSEEEDEAIGVEEGDDPGLCMDCGTQCYLDGSLAVLCPNCDGPKEESCDTNTTQTS